MVAPLEKCSSHITIALAVLSDFQAIVNSIFAIALFVSFAALMTGCKKI